MVPRGNKDNKDNKDRKLEIPKVIHYCWFGGGKKDKLFEKCYASWKKYFPEYEIIEWNEKNFDVNYNQYTQEAFRARKYAFVSDVARLVVLYRMGGIYFDTDVEVINYFPDKILREGYLAEEEDGIIATGLGFAAKKNNLAIKIMLDDYDGCHFVNSDGSEDNKPCPLRNSDALIKAGYVIKPGEKIAGLRIYNNEYFCGYDYKNHHSIVTDRTLSIHHYAASWKSQNQIRALRIKSFLSHVIGYKNYDRVKKIKNRLFKIETK